MKWKLHTKLSISVGIPLTEMKFERLDIMEVRSMTDEPSGGIRTGENTFTGLKIFETCPWKIKGVILKLAHTVVCVPMKCVDDELHVHSSCRLCN